MLCLDAVDSQRFIGEELSTDVARRHVEMLKECGLQLFDLLTQVVDCGEGLDPGDVGRIRGPRRAALGTHQAGDAAADGVPRVIAVFLSSFHGCAPWK